MESKISYIGSNLIEPIIETYKKLEAFNFSGSSQTQVSMNENGYSVSVITMCMVFVESSINRMKYFENDRTRSALEFFTTRFASMDIVDKMVELYILRDLLVHNHIWKIDYSFDDQYEEIVHNLEKLPEYGDKKYTDRIDKETLQTKTLELDILPIKVGKKDVMIMFTVLKDFINLMEKESGLKLNMHYKYNDRNLTFEEFLDTVLS